MPEEVRVHLSERKTDVTYEMAALADEYILTHRKTKEKTFTGNRVKFKAELRPKEENRRTFQSSSRTVVCFKCGKAGHIAIRCQLGKGPERNQTQPRKPQGAVTATRGNPVLSTLDEKRDDKRPTRRTSGSLNFTRYRSISVVTSTK